MHLLITFILVMFLLVTFLFRNSFGMSSRNTRRNYDVDITFDTLVSCPKCGDYYSGNPNYCPNCGAHLKED